MCSPLFSQLCSIWLSVWHVESTQDGRLDGVWFGQGPTGMSECPTRQVNHQHALHPVRFPMHALSWSVAPMGPKHFVGADNPTVTNHKCCTEQVPTQRPRKGLPSLLNWLVTLIITVIERSDKGNVGRQMPRCLSLFCCSGNGEKFCQTTECVAPKRDAVQGEKKVLPAFGIGIDCPFLFFHSCQSINLLQ